MRFFLVPNSAKPDNTVPLCMGCIDLPVEQLLDSLQPKLSQEEAAYVVQRRGQAYLDSFRIGG